MHKIKLPARIDNLDQFREFVTSFAEEEGFLKEQTNKIALPLEEAIVNICNYAYPDRLDGEIEVCCSVTDGEKLIIQILDSGVPFDMESQGDPDISADVSERKIGGLGIFLIKKMMDEVKYLRKDNHNILTITLKKQAAK